MKLQIIGNGSFGSFLKELLNSYFEIVDDAESVILAIPLSAYKDVSSKNKDKHLINVCSVQKPSTDICLKYSNRVTSIHPLFGKRTPVDKRNTIVCRWFVENDTWLSSEYDAEMKFIHEFSKVSKMFYKLNGKSFTTELHDQLMAKTHVSALMAAQQMKVFIDRVKDIPDELLPNSFRLMKEFVKTLDDMPKGTIESIMANPYI